MVRRIFMPILMVMIGGVYVEPVWGAINQEQNMISASRWHSLITPWLISSRLALQIGRNTMRIFSSAVM